MANRIAVLSSLLLTLSASALAACGPCVDRTPVPGPGGGSVIVAADMCDGEDSTGGSETGSGGASETSATPTGGDGSSTGDDIVPAVCTALPEPGEAWGPCIAGACNPGAGFCRGGEFGTLCMPACDQGCPMFKCIGGECRADGACVPPCADDSDCPLPGMQCDMDAPRFPTCVHPE